MEGDQSRLPGAPLPANTKRTRRRNLRKNRKASPITKELLTATWVGEAGKGGIVPTTPIMSGSVSFVSAASITAGRRPLLSLPLALLGAVVLQAKERKLAAQEL